MDYYKFEQSLMQQLSVNQINSILRNKTSSKEIILNWLKNV